MSGEKPHVIPESPKTERKQPLAVRLWGRTNRPYQTVRVSPMDTSSLLQVRNGERFYSSAPLP